MRYIVKNSEPNTLKEYKRIQKVAASYGNLTRKGDENGIGSKEAIQFSLLEEQGHICAYCMKRISQDEMKIEHWYPQSSVFKFDENAKRVRKTNQEIKQDLKKYEVLMGYNTGLSHKEFLDLDYNNMLGVCDTKGEDNLHCDSARSKSNKLLTIRPTDKRTISQIKFTIQGSIYSDNCNIHDDIDNYAVLNLNHKLLVNNRKRVWDTVLHLLQKVCRGLSEKAALKIIQTQYDKWNNKSQTVNYTDSNGNSIPCNAYFEYCQIVVYFLEKRLTRK